MEEQVNTNQFNEDISLNTEKTSCENTTIDNQSMPTKSNNNKSILLIITLIVACVALIMSIISFINKDGNSTTTNAKIDKVVQTGNLKIAYINTDTIMAKYTMAIEMQKSLSEKQASIENSLKNQYTQLQKEEQEYLKTGQNLTLSQQQAKEKEFQQREQQLSQAMQQQPAQFQVEVANQNEKLLNAVLAFVKDYNAKHDKFNIIFSNSRINGPTLYIDEGMDITDEIVKGLNEEYEQVKKNK